MAQPDNDTMEVLVIVRFPELQSQQGEKAWEEAIVDAVSAAVHADKTLDTIEVRRLEHDDCTWIYECGMPIPDYDMTIGDDGKWHSGVKLFPENPEARGDDLQSLFDYLVAKGKIKK